VIEPSASSADSIDALLPRSTDELLVQLAQSSTVGGLPFGFNQLRSIGAALFVAWWNVIKDEVCRHYKEINLDAETATRDAALLVDALLAQQNQPPLATVSVLAAKYGLDRLCREGPENILHGI
jgi:hypothetical protein